MQVSYTQYGQDDVWTSDADKRPHVPKPGVEIFIGGYASHGVSTESGGAVAMALFAMGPVSKPMLLYKAGAGLPENWEEDIFKAVLMFAFPGMRRYASAVAPFNKCHPTAIASGALHRDPAVFNLFRTRQLLCF
eukprot:13630-Heterococcus_DN1.PRE.4